MPSNELTHRGKKKKTIVALIPLAFALSGSLSSRQNVVSYSPRELRFLLGSETKESEFYFFSGQVAYNVIRLI